MKAIEADPASAVKIKRIYLDHKIELEKILLERDRLGFQDVAGARSREVEITRATGARDINLYALAWLVVAGFFILCGALFKFAVPQGQSDVVFMLFGALASGFGAVIQYFFGSSKSSQTKTMLLAGGKGGDN